jgi:hypothetical protein
MTDQEVAKLPITEQMQYWAKVVLSDMEKRGIKYPAAEKEVETYISRENLQLQLI